MSNEVKSVRIIEDIEEAISREVRRITFMHNRTRSEIVFQDMFNPFTGELVRQPIEPNFFDEAACSNLKIYPRFTVSLLKFYEDTQTHRLLPPYGNEDTETIQSKLAYDIITGGEDIFIEDDTGDVVITSNTKIRQITDKHLIRLLNGNNTGTYKIKTVEMDGNGPHYITLDNILLSNLPTFSYNKISGTITFTSYIDLSTIHIGDIFYDKAGNTFNILATNIETSSIVVAAGSAIVGGSGTYIERDSPILSQVETGPVAYLILDPAEPITDKSSNYRARSWPIPYTFLYFIKVSSAKRQDHIAIADRMMQVFNPPRGSLLTLVRSDKSSESLAIKDVEAGSSIIFVDDASTFYVNDKIQLFSGVDIGEELTILSVNKSSNSITVSTAITKTYLFNDNAKVVSNVECRSLERDFMNHMTEDVPEQMFWVHRFTFKIEAWVDSRIPEYETEQTFEEIGDVNFIGGTLESLENIN